MVSSSKSTLMGRPVSSTVTVPTACMVSSSVMAGREGDICAGTGEPSVEVEAEVGGIEIVRLCGVCKG